MPILTSELQILIDAPVERVFMATLHVETVADLQPRPTFLRDYAGDGFLKVGDTFTQVIQVLGREFETYHKVLEIDEPHKYVLETKSKQWDSVTTQLFEPQKRGGTLLKFITEGSPNGFFATLTSQLIQGMYQREIYTYLRNKKKALEENTVSF